MLDSLNETHIRICEIIGNSSLNILEKTLDISPKAHNILNKGVHIMFASGAIIGN